MTGTIRVPAITAVLPAQRRPAITLPRPRGQPSVVQAVVPSEAAADYSHLKMEGSFTNAKGQVTKWKRNPEKPWLVEVLVDDEPIDWLKLGQEALEGGNKK